MGAYAPGGCKNNVSTANEFPQIDKEKDVGESCHKVCYLTASPSALQECLAILMRLKEVSSEKRLDLREQKNMNASKASWRYKLRRTSLRSKGKKSCNQEMKATMKVKQVPLALFTEEARFMLTNTTINDGKMRA
jgi:hypothetical protein